MDKTVTLTSEQALIIRLALREKLAHDENSGTSFAARDAETINTLLQLI